MTILEKIVAHKEMEVARNMGQTSLAELEKSIFFSTDTLSLKHFLLHPEKSGIIAEFKRKSPSKGDINSRAEVETVTMGYAAAGASGLSILTDEHFFNGSNDNLTRARKVNFTPILRKEFIIHEYQIHEAKAIGADVILLIAECLDEKKVLSLAKKAKELGMEVLLEIHAEEQLVKCNEYVDIVGVNNRNLKTFSVDVETSANLFSKISNDFVKISESGLHDPATIVYLKNVGFQGFLIGEFFMKAEKPHEKCAEFIRNIQMMEQQQ